MKELLKEIESGDFGNTIAFRYGSKWKFSFGAHTIKASMFITKSGDVYYLLTFPEVEASDNQFKKIKSWETYFHPYLTDRFTLGGSGADIGPLRNGKIVLKRYVNS